ncbi:MAG: nitrite reductase/ring-hydroxylating ferredoxin subunit [Gammaproteobacteria bacterium]|jgi:nitrite reductase/ring-hydroxylating ferredoxin subunit
MPLAPTAVLRANDAHVCTNLAGWPLFAWRDENGTLRAFHNICRHQSMPILKAGCGELKKLRCPYHGWTYAQDGRLTHAAPSVRPDVDDLSSIQLKSIGIAAWRGLHFVTVAQQNEVAPPGQVFGVLDAHMPDLDAGWDHAGTDQIDLRCNWKTYLDYGNALQSPTGGPQIDVHGEQSDSGVVVINDCDGLWLWAWPLLGVHVTEDVVAVSQLVARTMMRSSLERHVFVRAGVDADTSLAFWRRVGERSKETAEAAQVALAASSEPNACTAPTTPSPARFSLYDHVRTVLE